MRLVIYIYFDHIYSRKRWNKRKMYILHLVLKSTWTTFECNESRNPRPKVSRQHM